MPAQHPAATFETRNASATSPGLRLETHNTFAPENWTKNTHFSPAKAMTVSVTARSAPAKAMAVSNPRKHARAKATGVSDNRAAYPTGHRRGTRGRTTLQTSSNRSNLKALPRTSVTNVVNLRPKTTIFSEKAAGLTTFVTTRKRTARNRSARGPCDATGAGGTCRGARGRRRGLAGLRADAPISDQAPLVWRAPEGPEGAGGLRGAAPNEVRSPSLAGGRGLRRPEHPWGHTATQHHHNKPPRTKRGRDRFPGRGLATLTHRRSANQAPPAIRRSCPRDPRPRRGQPRAGRRGRGTGSRTRSRRPRCGRSGSTAGRHHARHTRRA